MGQTFRRNSNSNTNDQEIVLKEDNSFARLKAGKKVLPLGGTLYREMVCKANFSEKGQSKETKVGIL